MAKEGLCTLFAVVGLLAALADSTTSAAPPEDKENSVTITLAVQTAMHQGRDLLTQNKPREAVDILERQLPRINGNPVYLALLRDAYRAYVRDLRLNKEEAQAQVYLQRLNILEPGVGEQSTIHAPALLAQLRPAAPTTTTSVAAPPPKATKVRAYPPDEDDPFRQTAADKQKLARDLLAQAEEAFSKHRFQEANHLYKQANQADQQVTQASKERWAYCMLSQVVEQLNHQSTAYDAMDRDVRAALDLAPRIEYGKQLLTEIGKRRSGQTNRSAVVEESAEVPPAIQNLGRTADGWSVSESTNFRIYHDLSAEWVQQTAQVAERTRARMYRKWFGKEADPWSPKCEIYLHKTSDDYSRATGVQAGSPGHSKFELDAGRVLSRRIDLHCDENSILAAVLPHETTHVVLAGNFGTQPVPRWVDEGIAVLTEPREKIDRHLRNLPRHHQENQLFTLRSLIQMNDYPEPQRIGPFYAQSVSVVEFLAHEKDPQTFTQFVREGLRAGYENALVRYYGLRTFEELEQRWRSYALGEYARAAGIADNKP
jgi:hypothetical protein